MSDITTSGYFLKLDGVTGESAVPTHMNEISVLSWSWGGTSKATVGRTSGSGAATLTMYPVEIVALLDSGVSKLGDIFANGTHVATGTLCGMKTGSGEGDFLTISLTQIFIAAFSVNASGETPIVSLSLTYQSITTAYKKQQTDGTLVSTASYKYDATTAKSS
jgi:type VI secretion system secreted protein Hcp